MTRRSRLWCCRADGDHDPGPLASEVAELTNAHMAGLGDVIEVLKGANIERLGTVLDYLHVRISQSGYVSAVRAITDEIARLLGERPD